MKRFIFLITLFTLFTSIKTLKAQSDHLEPVTGLFNDYNFQFEYYSAVRNILFKGLSDNPEIRFIVLPSFGSEDVLDIENENDKYYLIYHQCKESIWYSKDKGKIKVEKIKAEISLTSVELIKKLYKIAISQTSFPENNVGGLDGTNYYFTISDFGQKTGTIWSPPAKSKMSRLVEISYDLIKQTKAESDLVEFDIALTKRIEDLILSFN